MRYAILSALYDSGPQSEQDVGNTLDLDKSHLVGRVDWLGRR